MQSIVWTKNQVGESLVIAVDFNASQHLIDGVSQKNETMLVVSPEMAKGIISGLEKLLEWTKSPLYQWTKNKTRNR
jgi:hypothetical protein